MFVCLVGWFLNVLVNNEAISRTGPKTERLRIVRAATRETEAGDHDFCLSRSHYTNTDPTSRERAVTAGIEPGTSSQGVARSTHRATAPPGEILEKHNPSIEIRKERKSLQFIKLKMNEGRCV